MNLTIEEAREELEKEKANNVKLAQIVMELTQKLTEASAIIESLRKMIEAGGHG